MMTQTSRLSHYILHVLSLCLSLSLSGSLALWLSLWFVEAKSQWGGGRRGPWAPDPPACLYLPSSGKAGVGCHTRIHVCTRGHFAVSLWMYFTILRISWLLCFGWSLPWDAYIGEMSMNDSKSRPRTQLGELCAEERL